MNFQQFIQVNLTTFNQNIDRNNNTHEKTTRKVCFSKLSHTQKNYLGQIFPKKKKR